MEFKSAQVLLRNSSFYSSSPMQEKSNHHHCTHKKINAQVSQVPAEACTGVQPTGPALYAMCF